MSSAASSEAIALHVLQRAALILAHWVNPKFNPPFTRTEKPSVVIQAEKIVGWTEAKLAPLQLVFDQIKLENTQARQNYRPAWALKLENGEEYPRIPYVQAKPTEDELQQLKSEIQQALPELKKWDNLTQLTMFVEKFGSHLSLGASDIALIDLARSTAAVAAALVQSPDERLALVGGDLMGVQKFIYTISSEGALKSLRARSFYLELATEEIVQQLLDRLNLPRTNVIYAGASKFYLLAPAIDGIEKTLKQIQKDFNDWLLETFQRKVFLAIAYKPFSADQLKVSNSDQTPLAGIWQQVNDKLTAQASRKFEHQIDTILQKQPSYQPCKVCHRDDEPEEKLQPLSNFPDEDSVLACETCRSIFALGDRLPDVTAFVRSSRQYHEDDFAIQSVFYHPITSAWRPNQGEIVFQINNWDLRSYSSNQFVPMLLGNYSKRVPKEENSEENRFIAAGEMAKVSEGIQRVGYLRMDVDRLSQIFSKGLGEKYTLPRLASLSRQMTYFFKVYLNSLAEYRAVNFTDYQNPDGTPKFKAVAPLNTRENLLFIYAGGDDLFISGAWNEVVDFAFDVYQSFRAYTGWHPDITLSAGINIVDAKFPLYQAAAEAGETEKAAKGNGRDSLGLFNATLKWDEWLGKWSPEVLRSDDRDYLNSVTPPTLFGVFPFVERLSGKVGQSYTRSFVRNLLNTAQTQEAKIKEAKEKHPDQEQDIRYYLHLPKVAYTLARLPNKIVDDSDFRKSLKSPYNAPYFRAIATWIELLNR